MALPALLGAGAKSVGKSMVKSGGKAAAGKILGRGKKKQPGRIVPGRGEEDGDKGGAILKPKTSVISASKFLPSSSNNKAEGQEKTEVIKEKLITIAGLLEGTLASKKKEETDKKKKEQQERRGTREAKLEKKPKTKGKLELPKVPGMSFLDRIKQFIMNVLGGYLLYRLIEFAPLLTPILKGIMQVGEWLIDFGGKLLNGLVTFIDWGYKAYDWTRGQVKNIFGEEGAKKFDDFAGLVNKLLNGVLIGAMVAIKIAQGARKAALKNGGRGGTRPTTRPGQGFRPKVTTTGGRGLNRPDIRNPFRQKPNITGSGSGPLSGIRESLRKTNPLKQKPNVTGSGGATRGPLSGIKETLRKANPFRQKPNITGSGGGFQNPFKNFKIPNLSRLKNINPKKVGKGGLLSIAMIGADIFMPEIQDFVGGVYGSMGFGIQKQSVEQLTYEYLKAEHAAAKLKDTSLGDAFSGGPGDDRPMLQREFERRGLELPTYDGTKPISPKDKEATESDIEQFGGVPEGYKLDGDGKIVKINLGGTVPAETEPTKVSPTVKIQGRQEGGRIKPLDTPKKKVITPNYGKGIQQVPQVKPDNDESKFSDSVKAFNQVDYFGPILATATKILAGNDPSQSDYKSIGAGFSNLLVKGFIDGKLKNNLAIAYNDGGIVSADSLQDGPLAAANLSRWVGDTFKGLFAKNKPNIEKTTKETGDTKKNKETPKTLEGMLKQAIESLAGISPEPDGGGSTSGPGSIATVRDSATGVPMTSAGQAPGAVQPDGDIVSSMGFSSEDWNLFRNTVAQIESGGKYDIAGGSGGHYDGRYQLGAAAKTDGARYAGVSDPGHGEVARESFRKNAELQEKLFAGFTKANHTYLMGVPEYKDSTPQRKLQILGYAHNQGMGGAANWMKTGVVGADGFGTKGTKYTDSIAAEFRNRAQKMQFGGEVNGQEGIDKVPAMLTSGEFVMDKDSTMAIQTAFPGFLSAVNKAEGQKAVEILMNYASYNDPTAGEVVVIDRKEVIAQAPMESESSTAPAMPSKPVIDFKEILSFVG
mgnify:FL=1